jgi:hypothetical protein
MPPVKFDEAIAFYKQKLPLPTETWNQIINESQDWAFTLAGVEKASVLQSVFDLILKVIEGRSPTLTTYEDFAQNFNQAMVTGGYSEQAPWRTKLVFKQNIKTAYSAGKYRSLSTPEMIKRRPYWQYIHGDPIIPRPHHKALHLKVWRADDPIWSNIMPKNGFGCNCDIVSLSDRDMEREGLELAPPITERINIRDRLSGQTQSVPAIAIPRAEFSRHGNYPAGAIIDGDMVLAPIAEPGFNYAPGKSQPEQQEEILKGAIARLSPKLQELINNA